MIPLLPRIIELGRRARRLRMLQVAAAAVAALLLVGLLLGGLDALVRWRDPGIRWITALVFGGIAVALATAVWKQARSLAREPVTIARLVERNYPNLRDRLSSAVAFLQLEEADPRAGSVALRRRVILETADEVERLPLEGLLDQRAAWRLLASCAALTAVIGVIGLIAPHGTGLALTRLLTPWNDANWPREHELDLKERVTQVARGQPFEIEIFDHQGDLPEDLRIEYQTQEQSGTPRLETHSLPWRPGSAVARRENVLAPFSYRVLGGDDDTMPWQSVAVIEPAQIAQLQIMIQPPAYTGWPAYPAERRISALAGSRIDLTGAATHSLSAAAIHAGDARIALEILDPRTRFKTYESVQSAAPNSTVKTEKPSSTTSAAAKNADSTKSNTANQPRAQRRPWILERTTDYTLDLRDINGLRNNSPEAWEARAIADALPEVDWAYPASSQSVTATALVPLRGQVHDDLAIQSIELVWARSDLPDAPEQTKRLYQGAKQPPKLNAEELTGLPKGQFPGADQAFDQTWDLTELKLSAGVTINVALIVHDYAGQTTRSPQRSLNLITSEQLAERLTARQNAILQELARILKLQQSVQAQVAPLVSQLIVEQAWPQSAPATLAAAEQAQRQIARGLVGPNDGVMRQIAALSEELRMNRLGQNELASRTREILDELRKLERGALPLTEREFASAARLTANEPPPAAVAVSPDSARPEKIQPVIPPRVTTPELAAAVKSGLDEQTRIIGVLEKLLGSWSEWTTLAVVQGEVQRLLAEQQDVAKQTANWANQTVGKSWEQLTPAQRESLQALVARQNALAARLEKLAPRLQALREKLDANAVAAIEKALATLSAQDPQGAMRAAARGIGQNRLGQATEHQARALRILEQLGGQLQKPGGAENGEKPPGQADELHESLTDLLKRQRAALETTQRLEAARGEAGWTAAQLKELTATATDQEEIQEDLVAAAEALPLHPVLQRQLLAAAAAVVPAIEGLADDRTDLEVQAAQTRAATILESLLAALELPSPAKESANNAAQNNANPAPKKPVDPRLAQLLALRLAELNLLKQLQSELNQRTVKLDQRRAGRTELTDDERREYAELATEQRRLRELLSNLLPEPPEEELVPL